MGGRGRRRNRKEPARAVARAVTGSDSIRKSELLQRVVEHLLEHGIGTFSLRSASDLVGASARMLVHHFGSKERLVSEALALVRTRRVAHFAEAMASPVASFDEVFRQSWRVLASPEFRRYFVLNHETLGLAMRERERYEEFLRTTTEEWRGGLAGALLAQGFSPDDASAVSTLYLAALRGLLLDLAVTGDEARVGAAVDLLAAKLKADLERNGAVRTDAPDGAREGSPGSHRGSRTVGRTKR